MDDMEISYSARSIDIDFMHELNSVYYLVIGQEFGSTKY